MRNKSIGIKMGLLFMGFIVVGFILGFYIGGNEENKEDLTYEEVYKNAFTNATLYTQSMINQYFITSFENSYKYTGQAYAEYPVYLNNQTLKAVCRLE